MSLISSQCLTSGRPDPSDDRTGSVSYADEVGALAHSDLAAVEKAEGFRRLLASECNGLRKR
ncbi:hypothetical protein ACVWZR_002206 [Bradyrhizobium sp. i1.3.1]